MKNIRIFIWKILIFGGKIFSIFEHACFCNEHFLCFNPFMSNGLFYFNSLDWSISNRRDIWLTFIITIIIEISVINANSIDPDQTPRSVASDLFIQFAKVPFMGR